MSSAAIVVLKADQQGNPRPVPEMFQCRRRNCTPFGRLRCTRDISLSGMTLPAPVTRREHLNVAPILAGHGTDRLWPSGKRLVTHRG
jgi:hypothetical protein